MLPNHPAKQVQLQKLHSIKKVELRANFMFSTKLLKKYPRNQCFICSRGVERYI
jgi:sulfur relay (sulfurtransferase) DsrF/TusC family protein